MNQVHTAYWRVNGSFITNLARKAYREGRANFAFDLLNMVQGLDLEQRCAIIIGTLALDDEMNLVNETPDMRDSRCVGELIDRLSFFSRLHDEMKPVMPSYEGDE